MTRVKIERLEPVDGEALFWQGVGIDTTTGERVTFGGIRDWAAPIKAANLTEIEIEPEGLVLDRQPPED